MADKSTKGLQELKDNFLQTILGVTPETAERIMRVIKEKGEFSSVNNHMRALPGDIFQRVFRDVEKAKEHLDKEKGKEKEDDTKDDVKESKLEKSWKKSEENYARGETMTRTAKDCPECKGKGCKTCAGTGKVKKEVKESVKTHSFGSFLQKINEMGDDIRPAMAANEITNVDGMRLTAVQSKRYSTMNSEQKKKFQFVQKSKTKNSVRAEISTEQDPKVKGLLNKRKNLVQQMDKVNNAITAARNSGA